MGVVILSDDDLCERVTDIAHEVKGESKPPQRLASYLMDFFGSPVYNYITYCNTERE